ncbi:MAG: hypothetical protein LBP27_01465 [Treponema sp.]|jgi:hypothetical protein|nr:hypothetical protein [Treponema sp.]
MPPKLSALSGKMAAVFSRHGVPGAGFLRITFFSGLILFFALGAVLAVSSVLKGGKAGGDAFHRSLREYDRAWEQNGAGRGGNLGSLDSMLDKMEKKAEGVEALLSVLKRRRLLSRLEARYVPAYQDAARRAIGAYPYSEVLAAVAAGALVGRGAINGETEAELRELMPLLTDARFSPLFVSLHVLLGDLKNPESAAGEFNTAGLRSALAAGLSSPGASSPEREIIADLALLKLLNRENPAPEIRNLIAVSPSPESVRFAAEYFYDFGDPLRSAELFSLLPDEAALSRQADALWLGGYAESARNIWKILAAPAGADAGGQIPRALYNLALSAADESEERELLGRLAALPESSAPGRTFGLIRYSRLFSAPQGIAILESAAPGRARGAAADGGTSRGLRDPLVELELLRRGAETWEPGRTAGEIWLLLGRHGGEENLYQWAAWYFGLQRNYGESAALLKIAARRGFSGEWLSFREALQRIRDGGFDEAEESLRRLAAGGGTADWTGAAAWAGANLGLVLEARRSPAGALEYYEKAAAALQEGDAPPEQAQYRRETCSRIRFCIARCLLALGRPEQSRRALEYALDLNPDNLKARLELDRMGRNRGNL